MSQVVFLGDGVVCLDGCASERDVIRRVFEYLQDYEDSECFQFCVVPTENHADGLPLEGEMEIAIYGKTEEDDEDDEEI